MLSHSSTAYTFAYQKVLRDAAGDLPTQTVTSLCVPVVEAALGKVAPGLTETDNMETALSKLGKLLVASKYAERAYVDQGGCELRYEHRRMSFCLARSRRVAA